MKFRLFILSLLVAGSASVVKAQGSSKFTPSDNKHEVRLSVSDGAPLTMSNLFGTALGDAIFGMKRTEQKASVVYGVGYRYALHRFKVGADLGFATCSSKQISEVNQTPTIKERELHLMVLPTGEFTYFKRGLVELYGSAAVGMYLSKHTEKGLNEEGNKLAAHNPSWIYGVTYQVNPIALRIGNDRIGGFVEAGMGLKGFVTAGLSLKF